MVEALSKNNGTINESILPVNHVFLKQDRQIKSSCNEIFYTFRKIHLNAQRHVQQT